MVSRLKHSAMIEKRCHKNFRKNNTMIGEESSINDGTFLFQICANNWYVVARCRIIPLLDMYV